MRMNRFVTTVLASALVTFGLLGVVYAEYHPENCTYGGEVNFDRGCLLMIKGTVITSTAAELNIMHGVTATYSEINDACDGSGITAGTAHLPETAVETVGQVKQTVLTVSNLVLYATDGSDEGESTNLYTFPKGEIVVLSAVSKLRITSDAHATGNFDVGIGQAACNDAADLTSTEVDLGADLQIAGGTSNSIHDYTKINAAPVVIDGTAAAGSMYLNIGVADSAMSTTGIVFKANGTITLNWIFGGSNQ